MSLAEVKKPRTRRSEAQWREVFDRFERSGQTRERFCREQGIALSSFDRWRAVLRKQAPAQATRASPPLFVELSQPVESSSPVSWDVELQLGADVILRLRRPC